MIVCTVVTLRKVARKRPIHTPLDDDIEAETSIASHISSVCKRFFINNLTRKQNQEFKNTLLSIIFINISCTYSLFRWIFCDDNIVWFLKPYMNLNQFIFWHFHFRSAQILQTEYFYYIQMKFDSIDSYWAIFAYSIYE